MIARLLARLGIEYDELDLADDPRYRAVRVLLTNAADAERRVRRLTEEAHAQLEAVAVQAVRPRRRRAPVTSEVVIALPKVAHLRARRSGS